MADEPKAGSEIDWATADSWASINSAVPDFSQDCNLARAYLTLKDEVIDHEQTERALRAELAAIKSQASDATEYVLAVENRELRAEVERLYGKVQGHGLVSAERDALRARLAEVSDAAAHSLKTWGTAGAGAALLSSMTALEAILAKGDRK